MGQRAGKPHHFSTLLHHLFKFQGLLASRQQIEACLQTVVVYNPWFPDEDSFDLKIWNWVNQKMLNETQDWEKIFQWISGPCGPSLKAMILPFQDNSSPPDIRQ